MGIERNRRERPGSGLLTRRPGGEPHRQILERTEFDSLPDLPHEVKVIAEVMEGPQHRRGELAGPRQVVQEGPGRARTGWAPALRIERPRVVLETGILDTQH